MDNKQDKQFYWEVKQFLSNNQTPAPKPKSIGLNDISKMILESNNPYRTSSLHQDINSHDVIGQVMNYLGKENNKKALNSAAHKKITHTNAFAMLKEGIFDTAISSAKTAIASSSLSQLPREAQSSGSQPSGKRSYQLDDGTWVDEDGNPVPGSPLPGGGSVPTPTPTPASGSSSAGSSSTSVPSGMAPLGGGPSTGSASSPAKTVDDLIDDLYRARALPKGDGEHRSPEERAQARAQRMERNKAIASANIALRRYKDRPESEGGLTRKQREAIDPGYPTNLGGSKVALRYADKAAENALPFEDQPISPFYKISRREFRDTFGRDYDASGGANTNNMMALQNWKTNLSGRLTRGEEDWQGKMVDKAQKEYAMKNRDLLRRANSGDAAAAAEFKRGLDYVTAQARKANPVADYKPSDMDVPPGPGQGMGGRPYSPQAGERTAPTKPVERPLSAADQVALRASRCPGGICPEDKK